MESLTQDMLEAALEAARGGYKVFPLIPETKVPAVDGAFHAATTNEAKIREWWSGKFSGYSIGARTGDVIVVDADDAETTAKLEARFGRPDVKTRRGAHWYFAHPRDGRVVSGKAVWNGERLDKVDVKGDDALVEVPPSPGKEWVDGMPELETLPIFPRDLKPKNEAPLEVEDSKLDEEVLERLVEAYAARYPAPSLRHEAGIPQAGLLMHQGLTAADTRRVILEARKRQPEPITDATLRSIEGVVKTTAAKRAGGEEYTGGPRLEEFMPGITDVVLEVLGRPRKGYKLLTEVGNSERFVEQHGSKIRWVPKYNQWIAWDGRRWKPDDGGAAIRLAKATARALFMEAAREQDDERRKKIAAHATATQKAYAIKAMVDLAKSELEIAPDMLDSDPWLLNCQNGTLDLRTGELSPPDPADLITKLAPVEYDPDAAAPRFEQFLREVLVKDELIDYVRRVSGYTLTGSVRERSLMVLHGGGKNGKSTLTELLQDLLGDYSATVDVEVLLSQKYSSSTSSYTLAELAGARYVSTAEVGENRQLAEARVKAITGGDRVNARAPYGKPFDYQPHFKLWMSTNDKPTIRGTDDAIWDRIKLVPFNQRFEGAEADPTLAAKLREELPGVLAWAVRGCLEWQRDGILEPREVTTATEEYRAGEDTFVGFFSEYCFVKDGAMVRSSELWDAYSEHLRSVGEYNPGKQDKFNARVTAAGGTKKRSRQGMIWHGVGMYGDLNRPNGAADPDDGVGRVGCEGEYDNFPTGNSLREKSSNWATQPTQPTHDGEDA